MNRLIILIILFSIVNSVYSADDLDLVDPSDIDILKNNETKSSDLSDIDNLETLQSDLGKVVLGKDVDISSVKDSEKSDIAEKKQAESNELDLGKEEKELLEQSKLIKGKIPNKEWDEIAIKSKKEQYVIQKDETLWTISKNLFGSGFYYSKVWSLNPHITNPHQIEPGMTLVFSTGDEDSMPNVQLGEFEKTPTKSGKKSGIDAVNFALFGESAEPTWLKERRKLLNKGVFFQYASEETYEDLVQVGKMSLNKEYTKYEPPVTNIIISEPGSEYDSTGFDKSSKVDFNFSEGFFLNTFISTNIVLDLGEVIASPKEGLFIGKYDTLYAKIDNSAKAKAGDKFSVYTNHGIVEHKKSERKGTKYAINAQLQAIRKVNDLWECKVIDVSGLLRRGDRITVYRSKIDKIEKTFNRRSVDAAIISAYHDTADGLSYGDVIYLDRGRADGVEMGNVFEVFSFFDRETGKKISLDPTYKIGELTVITLTENFSTALITSSSNYIKLGQLAFSKTMEKAFLAQQAKSGGLYGDVKKMESNALDELDVELNLNDISDDLLDKVDKIELTDDELEELERQERDKSIIKDHESDLKELERLESEIVETEGRLDSAKKDADKFLSQQNLDLIEKNLKDLDKNGFESLNEIEKEVGVKFMDQDINSKENPYGLTIFDLEEIDELLNTDSNEEK